MAENLVIVESPAKAKTIEKILGSDFTVKSSYGHIRDLNKKGISINMDKDYEPIYEVSDDKKAVVAELRKTADKAKTVWLASDEDREGEAIAWHLSQVLELDPAKTKRIVFHEITKTAITNALETPRTIDMNIVNAQQARRVLDRLVGFELSPVLWKKVKPSLSAGRVQSVAVRLIAEREHDIMDFKSTDYYRVTGDFSTNGAEFKAELSSRLENDKEATLVLEACADSTFKIESGEKKPGKRSPAPPFTTSTLQQEASRKLGMSVSMVMSSAQRLYEAGLITYMRTDSTNLAAQAIAAIKTEVTQEFGEKYIKVRQYKTKSKGAQEAHEAIRPTYINNHGESISDPREKRLYDLIWKRTVASQMADAELEKTTAKISISKNQKYHFVATGEVIIFDGFLKLYSEATDEDASNETNEGVLPKMTIGDMAECLEITATQRFTSPSPRYSEASLVKKLEELGIGRPSTYAPTISTVITRGYVLKESRDGNKREYNQITLKNGKVKAKTLTENFGSEKNKLFPTDIGFIVTDYLEEYFPKIIDYNFTANVEKEFDEIADGKMIWSKMIDKFYGDFHDTVNSALEDTARKTSIRVIGEDPKSGKTIYAKIGKFGPYVQLGENEDEAAKIAKPQYANLAKGQLIASITLDEALRLFEIPRNVGAFEDKDMIIGIGKFGPYVRHDGKFVSLKKEDNPYTITAERAQELIEDKRITDAQRKLKSFAEDPDLEILNGRWGAYITYKKENYKLDKKIDPQTLDYASCMEIVKNQEPASSAKKGRFAKKAADKPVAKSATKAKKPATKKPAAKK